MRPDAGVQALPDSSDWRNTHARQQIVSLDARAHSGTIGQHFVGYQPAPVGRFTPPYAVIGGLRVPLLKKIHHRQHNETGRSYGQ
jgi:hypothetical protein